MNRILPIGLLGILISLTAGAEESWVSDQFEVMLRTGPSTSNAIERVLRSGTALEVLETDSEAGYARVRTTAGTEGWVLSRYLMNEPSAREQLERLTGQLTNATNASSSVTQQLDAVRSEQNTANNHCGARAGEKQS